MDSPSVTKITISGNSSRVWRKGNGQVIGFLAGFGGLPKWISFLDLLAEKYEVIVPSIPGFPGALGHNNYDNHLEWIIAIHDILKESGLLNNSSLIGSGPGGSLIAEVAALWPNQVKNISLISPWGISSDEVPMADPWAQRSHEIASLMCNNPKLWDQLKTQPEDADIVEWPIEQARALEASARIFWPLGNTGLIKRLSRITCPTLVIRGDNDRVISDKYINNFNEKIKAKKEIKIIKNAGHLAELDQPHEVAEAIHSFITKL